jgi:hypothetical protein
MFHSFLKRNNIKYHLPLDVVESYEKKALDSNVEQWKIILNNFYSFEKYPQIYSHYKSIDKYHFNDRELVLGGLHVFRRVFSQYAHNKRVANPNQKYNEEGIIIFEDFFDMDIVKEINKEFKTIQSGVVNKQPFNVIEQNKNRLPYMKQSIDHMKDLVTSNIDGKQREEVNIKYYQNTFAQRVDNSPDDNDNQKNFHVDTFFPAIKWWYFPEAVSLEQGPFMYTLKSCYPTEKYLDWIYQESIKCIDKSYDLWKLKDHQEGSFRASEKELDEMGFVYKPIAVKENTLVIGNVAGFHRRGDTIQRHVRNAIHGSIRINNPFEI